MIDMLAPAMDGLTTVKEIREFNRDIIVIGRVACSAAGLFKDVGIDDILPKPCSGKELSELIEKHFF